MNVGIGVGVMTILILTLVLISIDIADNVGTFEINHNSLCCDTGSSVRYGP